MPKVHPIVPVAVVLSLMSAPSALQALSSSRSLLPVPLHGSAGRDSIDAVQQLLAIEAAPPGASQLHWVVGSGDVELVKQVLADRPDLINQKHSRGGYAPLHKAVQDGHTEIVKVLIDAGAYLNDQSEDGSTPLHMGSEHGSIDIIKALLDAGAYIDPVDYDYVTPLHIAVSLGHMELVELLLDEGASLHARQRHDIMTISGHLIFNPLLNLPMQQKHGKVVPLVGMILLDLSMPLSM